ncbi:phage tail length tape measure family protein [Azospirillum griseum]|uniref:Transglycosylase SLT domain-containing protein n=1 Tax=Azospirillum griseum TaxID=2496639 RepID=A0A431VBU2_9PROT|nr:phage tail length tape measure family protein [Azospirillum griseum]RTR16164.1 hypothetical protein EJ903_21455 [Azospirillum griseum]
MSEEKIASLTVDGSGALSTLDQIGARMEAVGDRVESNSRRLASYGREFATIARSLGVYTDSWEKVKRVQEAAARAVDSGRISQEQANRIIAEAELRYDETARAAKAAAEAQVQAAAEMARATAATAQGLEQVRRQYDPAYAAAAKYRDEVARVSKVLEAAGVTGHEYTATLQAVAAALDPVTRAERQRAEETARAAEAQIQAQAALADELDRVRTRYDASYAEVKRYVEEMNRVTRVLELANVAEEERARILGEVAAAYDPMIRAEQERADAEQRAQAQAERATQEMIERERATQRAAAAQERFNTLLGVSTGGQKSSAARSASVFEDADREAQALQRLIDTLDPAAAAQRRFVDQQKQLDEALAGNKIDSSQHARLTKALQDQQAAFSGAARSATAHTRALQILSPQLSDIAVQAYSGTSALTILVQQGPQIFDGLMMAGKEAVVAAGRFAAMAAPVLAIGAALGTVAYGAARFNSDIREFDRTARLTSSAAGVMSGQFADFGDQVAVTAGVSQASAREIVTAYAATGRIGAGVLSDLTKATKDWALLTGRDTDEASADLAKLFSDPAKAVDELTSRYGLFDAAQARVIKNYQAQGNLERAQQLLLQGLEGRAAGASEKLTALEKGWRNLKTVVSDAVDDFARAQQGPSRQQQIQRVRWSLEGSGGYLTTAGRRADEEELARLERLESDDGVQAWAAALRAEFVRASQSVEEFARSVDPAIAAQQAYDNSSKDLAKAVELGVLPQQEATRLLGLYRRQLLDTIDPAQAFATEMERQARLMEKAAGRARDFEQERLATLQKRGAQPTDNLADAETTKINSGLDRKYAAEAADRHRVAQEAIIDARALAAATASLSQPAIIAAQAQATFFDVLRKTSDYRKAKQAEDDVYAKGMIEWSAQVDASVKSSELAVAAARRLSAAQAQGGDIAMAVAQAQNLYADQVARGVDPVRALALANADLQKSLAALSGQQAAWNRDLLEQITAARHLADAEGVSAAAVAEATIQNRVRAQVLKEGVPIESERARAIEAGIRALEAQNAAGRVNSTIRQGNRDLALARAEYELLGASNAERERAVAILKATQEVQDSADWQAVPQAARDAWVAQAGAVAEYQARVADATETSRSFASTIATGFEDALLSGAKLSDTMKSLAKDIEKVFLRGFVTKPLETWLTGTMTKLLSPSPVGDSAVMPVKAADPGGNLVRFQELASRAGASPVPVLVTNASGFTDLSATNATPLPVAVKSAAGLEALADQAAGKYGLDASLLKAVVTRESSWNPNAVNSRSGATGLGQVMPANWKPYGVTDPTDPAQNLDAAARILKEHLDRAGGDVSKALSTYSGHIKTSGDAYVSAVMATKGAYDRSTASMETAGRATTGVSDAQERALQAQLDAIEAQRSATDSTQTLTTTQQSWVDSALGMTSATKDASSVIEVQSRAVSHIGENAISAADRLSQAGDSAARFGAAAADGADSFLGGIQKLLGGASDWISGLFGSSSGSGQQQRVIRNADGSTSFAPASQGAGGSWLEAKVFGSGEAARPDASFVGPMPQQSGIAGWNPSWGQLLQGVGGIASGAMMATQKGATVGQKIGGGLTAAGGIAAMIPSGQIVGGVMMAAGALLSAVTGAKDRGTAYSRSNITLGANGKYALGSYAADNNGDPTKFNADASKVAKGLNDIIARLNLTATASNSFIDSKEKSAEQAALELLKGMRSGVPAISYAIAHETATSLDDMLAHLEFANGFQTQIKALRSSLSDLVAQFQTGVDAGNSLGKTLLDFVDNAQTVFAVSSGSKLPGFATGTLSAPSGWAVVGEEGPELVNLRGGERIWNARESARILAAQGEGRDDTIIHLRGSDELAAVRRALGTSGRVNPVTGLLGFDGGTASGSGGENAAHGETSSSTAGRDSAYGGGWGGSGGLGGRGIGAVLSDVASSLDSGLAAIAGTLANFAGWQAATPADTQAQTSALAGVAGLGMTAVAAGLSAIASELGPGITGMIEGLTGLKSTAPAVDTSLPGLSGRSGGALSPDVQATVSLLSDAIKADPSLSAALVGGMRVGGTDTNPMIGATVQDIVDTNGSAFGVYNGDHQQVLQQLDDAAQQLLTATGSIPAVLQRALDIANTVGAQMGLTPAISTRQAQVQAAQEQAARLQSKLDGVGLARARVSELNDIVVSLANNTFSPIGKDFDTLAADMQRASDAYVAAGQAVPDGLYGAMQQMLALGAVKKRLLDEVAGTTVETSPEEKAVEQLRGKWSTASTDLVKAFASVGIAGDELAAKLAEGYGNALRKEQAGYSQSLDVNLRKATGQEGYDSAVGLIDAYKAAVKDVNALWPEGADRAAQLAKVSGTLSASLSGLVKSGSITDTSLQSLIADFAATPDAVAAATAALSDLRAATAQATATFNSGVLARALTAVGNSRGAGLVTLNEQQRAELAAAKDAGRDTTQLQQVQAAERASQAFQLAQQDILGAYDQQISAQQDVITSLQEGAVAAATVARQFRQAFDSLALTDSSPLSDLDRLKEARRQFEAAVSSATSTTATDAERAAAQTQLQQLGPQLVQLARAYYATTNSQDYERVRAVFDQLGTLTGTTDGGTPEKQLEAAQSALKELQRQRADAAAIGQRQFGALSDLKNVLDQSYAYWQATLGPLLSRTNTTDTRPHYSAPAAVQSAWDGLSDTQHTGIARAMGWSGNLDEAFNIWLATDSGRARTFEAYTQQVAGGLRFSASDRVMAAWDALSAAQQADAAREAGYQGGVDAGLNAWAALGHGSALEAAILAKAKAAGIPGFARGTLDTPPGAVWVGEQGPELLWQGGGAAVASSADSLRIASSFTAVNDRLPLGIADLRPSNRLDEAALRNLAGEISRSRAEAQQDARTITSTIIVMMEKQIVALREENAELRRRVDKQGAELRIALSTPQYATKGR